MWIMAAINGFNMTSEEPEQSESGNSDSPEPDESYSWPQLLPYRKDGMIDKQKFLIEKKSRRKSPFFCVVSFLTRNVTTV